MKTTNILFALALLLSTFTFAQVGIGTTIPDASAALDIKSTTLGLLHPRMTTAERDLINSGVWVEGLTIYNTDTKCLELYNGTDWISVCDGSVVTTPPPTPTCDVSDGVGGFLTFMCHNLGADTSLDPDTPQKGLNGDYYQWGKSAPDADVDNLIGSTWGDQGGTRDNGNWTPSARGPNDPCPGGFRVPSSAEWQAVDDNNDDSLTGAAWSSGPTEFGNALHYGPDANGKLLTLPAAGVRNGTSGALANRGINGLYWSSTEAGSNAYNLNFDSSNVNPANFSNRARGFSVRCIAE
jgi:uncharacterized protein (TIGR02145 family)